MFKGKNNNSLYQTLYEIIFSPLILPIGKIKLYREFNMSYKNPVKCLNTSGPTVVRLLRKKEKVPSGKDTLVIYQTQNMNTIIL